MKKRKKSKLVGSSPSAEIDAQDPSITNVQSTHVKTVLDTNETTQRPNLKLERRKLAKRERKMRLRKEKRSLYKRVQTSQQADFPGQEENLTISELCSGSEGQSAELSKREKLKRDFESALGFSFDELKDKSAKAKKPQKPKDITCASLPVRKPGVEVVVYRDAYEERKKARLKAEVSRDDADDAGTSSQSSEGVRSRAQDSMDLKRTWYDVQKLGISGFAGERKESAQTQLLMRLGAKPPKNKYYNYKEFQEMRKNEKADRKAQAGDDLMQAIDGFKPRNQRTQGKRRGGGHHGSRGGRGSHGRWSTARGKNEVRGAFHGQIGRYKRGVQTLSAADMERGKTARVVKS